MSTLIRILIADDHSIVRRGLKDILEQEFADVHIEEVNNGKELMKLARSAEWDIVISDLTMPERNGLEVVKLLKEEKPGLPVLILSMHPEDQYALRVLRAGAAGYLTKESAGEELVKAVRYILQGRKYITPSIAEKMASQLTQDSSKQLHELLSDREFNVLKMIASGKTVSEIAELLNLSVGTISTYRARILEKMQLRTNAELTHYAIQQGLV
ncbi:MAG: response regulator transcription factor [Bacteroidota bacterium]